MSYLNMSVKTYSGENYTQLIMKLNHNRMIFQLPVIVFLSTIMTVSLIGNSLVVAVYRKKYKKRTSSYFIMVLAIIDLFSCLCIPFVIFDLVNPYMHPVPVICKINKLIEAWTSTASGLVLVCIAFDRYFHVCNPLGIYSIKQAQSLTIVMFAVAVSVAWPIIFLAGKRTIPTPIPGVYGEDCSYRDEVYNSIYTLLFQGGLFFAFFVNFWIFGVFYARIFYTIYKRSQRTIGEHISAIKYEIPVAKNLHKIKYQFNNATNNISSFIKHPHKVFTPNNENLKVRLTKYAVHPSKQEPEDCILHKTNGTNLSYIPVRDETDLKSTQIINGTDSKSTSNGHKIITKHISVPNTVDSKLITVLDDLTKKTFSFSNKTDSNPSSVSNKINAKAFPVTDAYNSKSHPALDKAGSKPNLAINSQIKIDLDNGHGNQNIPAKCLNSTTRTKQNTLKIRTTRTTIILAIVTLTAVLGFVPYLVVSLMNNFGSHFQYGMPIAEDLLFEFCSKSYFLNGAANPIIYSVMNPAFRHDSLVVLKTIAGIFRRK